MLVKYPTSIVLARFIPLKAAVAVPVRFEVVDVGTPWVTSCPDAGVFMAGTVVTSHALVSLSWSSEPALIPPVTGSEVKSLRHATLIEFLVSSNEAWK